LADESRIGESEEVPPWGWGSGCIMDMASKLLTKREKKEKKERKGKGRREEEPPPFQSVLRRKKQRLTEKDSGEGRERRAL
jgi:hypothetical protein